MVINALENIKAAKATPGVLNSRNLDEKENVDKVRVIMRIYSDLLGIGDEVNLCYGFQTLLLTAVIFLYSLITNFLMYKKI